MEGGVKLLERENLGATLRSWTDEDGREWAVGDHVVAVRVGDLRSAVRHTGDEDGALRCLRRWLECEA